MPGIRPFPSRSLARAALVAASLALTASAPARAADATTAPGAPLPAENADFRAARWGMSAAEVRRTEAAAPELAEGPLLVFPATVAGQPCRVVYFFRRDELCMGFYQWSDTRDDLSAYYHDADALRAQISAAYDEPPIENWNWEDPMFAEEPEMRAEALGLGLMSYELGWMNEHSIVAMRLSGGNLQADILIMYADRRCFPRSQDVFGAFFSDEIGVPSPYYRD
jgi:hypothetical protein